MPEVGAGSWSCHGHSSSAASLPPGGGLTGHLSPPGGLAPGVRAAAQRLLGWPKGSLVSYSTANTWGLCRVPAGLVYRGKHRCPAGDAQGELLLVALGSGRSRAPVLFSPSLVGPSV